jgi:uncharacterized protein
VRAVLIQAGIPVTDLRVRDLGTTARVEVPAADVEAVAALPEVRDAVREAGFASGGFEVSAFRSGRLNQS